MIPVKFVWEMQAGRDTYQMDHLGPRSFFAYGDEMEMEQSKLGQKNVIRPSYKTWIHKQKWFFTEILFQQSFGLCLRKQNVFRRKSRICFKHSWKKKTLQPSLTNQRKFPSSETTSRLCVLKGPMITTIKFLFAHRLDVESSLALVGGILIN